MLLLYEVHGLKQAPSRGLTQPVNVIRAQLPLETKRSYRVYYEGDSFTLNS
jgi:hypothetical protein